MEVVLAVNGIIQAVPIGIAAAQSLIALFRHAAPSVQVELREYQDGLIMDAASSLQRMEAWLAANPKK